MPKRRDADILKFLETAGTASIAQLALALGVSAETVRRDLRPLADSGAVLRMHGAVGLASQISEAPFQRRMAERADAKRAIARAAAASIRDGDSLMLDTGTTTSFLARALAVRRRLTVVTNSSDIARTLAGVNGNRVFMAGGEIRAGSGAALGPAALEFIRRFSVAHAIISAGAVDAEGIADFDLEEAEFARVVLSRGARRVVVTDQAKFGRRGLVSVCGFGDITELVTEAAPPADICGAMAAAGVKLTVA